MSSESYLQWLNSPTTAGLASNASLHYIPTTTTITEATAILKHLTAQSKQVEKKEEKVLNTVNGDRAAAIETSTTLKFNMGGGAYLPNIDSNLLDERTVLLPLTHIVAFDGEGKIQQIRLYWDQATLLKQAEAIGKSGRNWPIREGKAQSDLIASSVRASGAGAPAAPRSQGPSGNPQEMAIRDGHSKRDSVSVTRDPHASLALFNERDPNADRSYTGPSHATRASAKPAAREFGDMVAGEADAGRDAVHPRSGHSKNFSEIRLFNENDQPQEPSSPERKKTYTQKYDHFTFGDGETAPTSARSEADVNRSKSHSRALNFEDYATPEKHQAKGRPADERHWGAGVDTVSKLPTMTPRFNPFTSHFAQDDPSTSPPKRPIVHAARPDQQSHFEIADVSPLPAAGGPQKAKSLQRQKGMGLYHDPVMSDERVKSEPMKAQSTAQTNVDAGRRAKDYEAQYSMADDSPVPAHGSTRTAATTKSKARQDQESQWSFADTPEPASRKIYKTAGDGMGSRAGGRAWGIGDESDPEIDNEKPAPRRSARGRRREDQPSDELEF